MAGHEKVELISSVGDLRNSVFNGRKSIFEFETTLKAELRKLTLKYDNDKEEFFKDTTSQEAITINNVMEELRNYSKNTEPQRHGMPAKRFRKNF